MKFKRLYYDVDIQLPNDAHMLRFLRARDFDVQKVREMLVTSMQWRKQHQVDKILNSYRPSNVLLQFFPGGWHYSDKGKRGGVTYNEPCF